MADDTLTDPTTPSPADADPSSADATGVDAPDPAMLALRQEKDELYDRLLRKTAEFDNYRKRTDRERREQSDQAVVDLLSDLLLVVDDFDLALAVDPGDGPGVGAYRKGIELIHGKFEDFLKRRGVTRIDALGTDFDPNVHQAVVHEVSPEHREGEVIGELRRGYMLGDRLLRPAMVKVAKA